MDKIYGLLIIVLSTVSIIFASSFTNLSIDKKYQPNQEETTLTNAKVEQEKIIIEEKNENELPIENEIEEKNREYYIKVNYLENVVNIYTKDNQGEFTIPVKAMICSTGTSTPTSGIYKMSDRGTWGLMVGNVWAQYYSRIDGVILFHSVPYTTKSNNTLEYWEYDKLGTSASAGCVRLTVKDAKWIYDNCKEGTQVEFYADSNPGPLGKPTAPKISEQNELLRCWDPTDPNENNPWKSYEN